MMIGTALNLLIITIETICFFMFCDIFAKEDETDAILSAKELRYIVILSLISYVTDYFFGDYMVLKQILIIVTSAIAAKLYWNWKAVKALVISAISQGLLILADVIAIMAKKELLLGIDGVNFQNFILTVFSKLIFLTVIFVMYKTFKLTYSKYIEEKEWVIFSVIPIFSIMVVLAIVKCTDYIDEPVLQKLLSFLTIGLIFINIFMFYFMHSIGKRGYREREHALLDADIKRQMDVYGSINERMQKQRQQSHEYKNQIACIQSLCNAHEYDKLNEYLQNITHKVLHDMDYIDTNNTIINSILNVKYQEAMDAGILFISRINDLSAIKLDSEEVVTLLSNLLNNAIEACEKCDGQRIIKVKCTNDSDNFIIAIKNTYDGAIKKQGEEIVTTKNKNADEHGFGLKNVRQIVENNNGYMDIEYDEKEFSVSVIIPN